MKKAIKRLATAIIALCAMVSVSGQTANGVRITDIQATPIGNNLQITFRANISKKAVKKDYELVLTPSLANGDKHLDLGSIIVQGRRAKIAQQRSELSWGTDESYHGAVITRNGTTVEYRTLVAYQQWMTGATLKSSQLIRGCCSEKALPDMIVAQILGTSPREEVPVRTEVAQTPVVPVFVSTGDRLAESQLFIVHHNHYAQFRDDPDKYMNNDPHTNLTVYFRQGLHNLDFTYRDNRYSLDRLVAAMRDLQSSSDSKITKVVIAGFASPEGSIELNTRLGQARAEVTRRYLIENTRLRPDQIEIYNGKVNWIGLRKLVENSDMLYRGRVLDIIDNVPIWDSYRNIGRHGELMRLGGGEPYRYMMQHFFPELRQAAYIKVYYENK